MKYTAQDNSRVANIAPKPRAIFVTRLSSRAVSRLTVVSREAKEEVPCDGLSTNAREYFTRTNLVKIKNAITDGPNTLVLYYCS